MTYRKRQASDDLHSLLLKLVKLGGQAKQFLGDPNLIAVARFKSIQQESRTVITEASRLSATLDEDDENRQLFSAALILAAAAADDPISSKNSWIYWTKFQERRTLFR